MPTRTIGFAVADEDISRLERLTARFGGGNRSAFLREAMRQMDTVDRAARLVALQAYGAERSAELELDDADPVAIVRRVLAARSGA